ncbi:C6 transcription factor RegA [Sporothrix brasiliensis 5110]|uniref:C6 transcription factor RegA n=1 Tax=Sporothrix brasiliensis 5110 TaxID=1398154 RepID=A0A0C2J9R7_9PEZI|nr:C6 transcription factor RegA [Sporothrix brasiliensis 5110]KIH93632.1 C6 transcription factor RegA [Sporothrix brasiliensis 5110]
MAEYRTNPLAAGAASTTAGAILASPAAKTGTSPAKGTSAGIGTDDTSSLFQCGSCKRQYKRLDHLARHVRSHTQSRPYRCQVCTKAFARALTNTDSDLLKRHAAGHDRSDSSSTAGSIRSNGGAASSALRASISATVSATRVSRACQACSSNHLRCSETKPCQRCTSKGLVCVWDRAADMVVTPPATIGGDGDGDGATNDGDDGDDDDDDDGRGHDMTGALGTTRVANMTQDMTAHDMDLSLATPMMQPMQHGIQHGLQHGLQPMHAQTPLHPQPHVDDPPESFMRMLSAFDFSYKGASATAAAAATATATSNGMVPLALPPDNTMINHMPGYWTPMGLGASLEMDAAASVNNGTLDLGFDDLDDMDFRFLDAYNTRVPFEFGVSPTGDGLHVATTSTPWPGSVPGAGPEFIPTTSPRLGSDTDNNNSNISHHSHLTSSSAIGTGSEAFQRHYWRFRPNAQDHGGAEEHNLSLPSTSVVMDHTSPDSPLAQHMHPNSHAAALAATHTRLNNTSRDKILTVVTYNCRRENVARVVTSFPTVELLDTLLQFYLTSPVAQASAWLHLPSFHDNPNDCRPELLAALAAAGAVLTADSTLSKLGFAIQECLRIAVPRHWERDNSLTRDLELAHAYLLTLDIGLWSGRSRKVEIAESFFLPLLTMRRRDGSFGRARPAQPTPPVAPDDEGEALHQKWKAWVHREAVTRFAFRILQHDTNTSMALLTPPLVSYAEILLAFPAAKALWGAETAEQWKQLYLQSASARGRGADGGASMPATLPAFLEDPEAFLQVHCDRVDMGVVCATFLSCAWGLTWEYVQMRVLQREMATTSASTLSTTASAFAGRRRGHALVMGARQDEILQLIQSFRQAAASTVLSSSLSASDPTLGMRTELVLMHTHTVLEQVQLFAGMEGRDQARAVHPVIVEWVASEGARTSLWHAGQILRGTRQLARGVVSGPTAVMVYHAGLTLWIYGAVAASLPPDVASDGRDVLLDGDAAAAAAGTSSALQRFFVRGQGRPCISSDTGEVVPLSRPDGVMAVVAGLLRHNHGAGARPHMVESLILLLDEIQRASATV